MPIAQCPGTRTRHIPTTINTLLLVFAFVSSGVVIGQNLYFDNFTNCDYKVQVYYADNSCYYYPPPDAPGYHCYGNTGNNLYNAPAGQQVDYTTPGGSKICWVDVFDGSMNWIVGCSCSQVTSNRSGVVDCDSGCDIDISVGSTTTTIRWAAL